MQPIVGKHVASQQRRQAHVRGVRFCEPEKEWYLIPAPVNMLQENSSSFSELDCFSTDTGNIAPGGIAEISAVVNAEARGVVRVDRREVRARVDQKDGAPEQIEPRDDYQRVD
jgi:hypothetical protein